MATQAALMTQDTQSAEEGLPDRRAGLMKNRAYHDLKRLILEEIIEPGAFLSERQLAARLNMSKTPIKAALERLEAEGFIGVSPQQGIIVHDLSVKELAEQFEVREVLEPYVARRVAGTLTPEQWQLVERNLEATEQAARAKDAARTLWIDSEYHLMWCQFLGNQEIVLTMQRLRDRIHRAIRRVTSRTPERMLSSYQEHVQIATAILEGKGDLAARLAEEHLAYGRKLLVAPPT
jgi:DNA-binding GntR family transcriptional regulator